MSVAELIAVKRQLEQGHLPRSQFEPEFKELITLVSDDVPVDVASGWCSARGGGRQGR